IAGDRIATAPLAAGGRTRHRIRVIGAVRWLAHASSITSLSVVTACLFVTNIRVRVTDGATRPDAGTVAVTLPLTTRAFVGVGLAQRLRGVVRRRAVGLQTVL